MLRLNTYKFQCAAVASFPVIGLIGAVLLNGYNHQPAQPVPFIRTMVMGASFAVGLYLSVNALMHSRGIAGKTSFFILSAFYAAFELGIIWRNYDL